MLTVFSYVFAAAAAHITVIKSKIYYKFAISIGKLVKEVERGWKCDLLKFIRNGPRLHLAVGIVDGERKRRPLITPL
jgi:hypothetical protein